jgi:hypothetical protein
MPKILIKRGTRAQIDAAASASGLTAGELYLITDENRLAVGTAVNAYTSALIQASNLSDLSSAATARVNIGLDKRTAVADQNYQILATDRVVSYTSLSAARVVTLPAANAVNPGQEFIVGDISGSCSATNTLTITRAGSDTIDGATTEIIAAAYGKRRLISDGVSKWGFDKGLLRVSNNLSEVDASAAKINLGLNNVTNVAQLPSSYLDTDTALAANSDTRVPSQKAIKYYVDHLGGVSTSTVNTFTAAQIGALTNGALTSSSGSIAINMATSNNFSHTMTENTTLAAPTNAVAGQSGVIVFTQHASSAKTLAYNSAWVFEYGAIPTFTTVVGKINVLTYYVVSGSKILCHLTGDI